MSAELAVGLAAAAFVLMAGIVAGFGAVILLDAVTIWPPRRRPVFKSPGVRYFVHPSVIDVDGRPVR
jgi:type IV secretory pathway TrbD component